MSCKTDIIGIPLGTRLHAVVLHGGCVHVWIALKSRAKDYSQWQGTYLNIEPNGRVTRVTRDDAYTCDDEFVVKEADIGLEN